MGPRILPCIQWTFKYLWKEWKQVGWRTDRKTLKSSEVQALVTSEMTTRMATAAPVSLSLNLPFPSFLLPLVPLWNLATTHLILFSLGHSLGTPQIYLHSPTGLAPHSKPKAVTRHIYCDSSPGLHCSTSAHTAQGCIKLTCKLLSLLPPSQSDQNLRGGKQNQ